MEWVEKKRPAMYELIFTGQFKKDLNLMQKRGYDMSLFEEAVKMLKTGKSLGKTYEDHPLRGKYVGCRECHIKSDWLLVYRRWGKDYIELQRTGTHSDLY